MMWFNLLHFLTTEFKMSFIHLLKTLTKQRIIVY